MKAQTLATEIVRTLTNAGYTAYFAGGWVRDYLLGHPSEDIDIATNAPPQVILDLFPRTILVGLAFGVIIVVMDGHQFEVATFRRDIEYVDGRKPTQIELSTPQEDAARRDFTINGMFFDPIEEIVHDFVHGQEDLKHHLIRTIGDPYERFTEDRLRMIRAIRFSARFGFLVDPDTQEAIRANADTLFPAVAMERVWQEFCKMSKYPRFDTALIELHRLELLPTIFPELKGVHLNEIKHRVSAFPHYPEGVEPIWYILELFPHFNAQDVDELCTYLRTSRADAATGAYLLALKRASAQPEIYNKVEWAYLYANPFIDKGLQVIAAWLPADKRDHFMKLHQQRRTELEKHIHRLVEKKPLVNATILQEHGIVPGKLMGKLLKEAECVAIEKDYDRPQPVLDALKSSSSWPIDR